LKCVSGLLVADETIWRPHRKVIDSAFTPKTLTSFLSIFNEKSKLCVENFKKHHEKHLNENKFDVLDLVSKLALDNLLTTCYGADEKIQTDEECEFLEDTTR
jgi:cytochrome P450